MVTLAEKSLRRVMAQREVEGGEELEGKVVSADAGLLKAPFAQKVVQKRGPILA